MFQRLQAHLVDDWRSSWKWLSMQLAALFALVMAILSVLPGALLFAVQWWMQVPSDFRAIVGPVGAVVLLVMIALARLWAQKHPEEVKQITGQ